MCMGAAAYGCQSFQSCPRSQVLTAHHKDDTGFFGGTLALPSFMRDFGITKAGKGQTSANLVSLFQGGSFFGAGASAFVVEPLGRKWTIFGANIIFIASAFAQTFAAGSVGIFMFGRQVSTLSCFPLSLTSKTGSSAASLLGCCPSLSPSTSQSSHRRPFVADWSDSLTCLFCSRLACPPVL